jgi:hypothetical protein
VNDDELIQCIVRYCQKQSPEALDRIFDALPKQDETLSQRIVNGTVAQLQSDLDTLSWFCGYMASEINRREDSDRAYLPITELSKKLITAGPQPFLDFIPYIGQRLVILDPKQLEALPVEIRDEIKATFDLREKTGQQFTQMNEALKEELLP